MKQYFYELRYLDLLLLSSIIYFIFQLTSYLISPLSYAKGEYFFYVKLFLLGILGVWLYFNSESSIIKTAIKGVGFVLSLSMVSFLLETSIHEWISPDFRYELVEIEIEALKNEQQFIDGQPIIVDYEGSRKALLENFEWSSLIKKYLLSLLLLVPLGCFFSILFVSKEH